MDQLGSEMDHIGSAEDGNTKSHPPRQLLSKGWFFTWNNYPIDFLDQLDHVFRKHCEKYIFEKEIGDSGTPHIQGCIVATKRIRPIELFKLPKAIHWERTRNQLAAEAYCEKEALSRNGADCWKFGFPKPIKIISTLRPWQMELTQLMMMEPDDRSVYWIYDPDGGIGKSVLLKYWTQTYKDKFIFCNGGKCADLINLVFNQDMDKCDTIVWDLPRNRGGHVSFDAIECIKNGMVCNTKYETGVKVFNSPHIVVFANELPSDLNALSADRWHIYTVDANGLIPYNGTVLGKRKVLFTDEPDDEKSEN